MTPLVVSGDGMAWAWTALEITAVRDVPAEQALPDQATYLDRLLAAHPGEVFALRWLRSEPGRLRLWLLARTSAAVPETAAARAVALAEQLGAVPPQVIAEPLADPAAVQAVLTPFVPAPDGLAQIGKRVRAQSPERPDAGVDEYLAVEPFARDPVDWAMLLDLLAASPHPLAVTVALAPERVAAQVRRTLETEAARFERLAEPRDDGGTRLLPDSAAAGLAALFQDALARYGDRAFRFGVTVAAPVTLDGMVVEALGRTVSPAGYAAARPGRPAEYEALAHALATLQPVELPEPALPAQLAADLRAGGVGPVRRGLLDLRCLVDRVEARALFRLPVAADGHVPGFPVVAAAVPAAATLLAGRHAEDGSEVRFPVRDVSIGGTPGWARAATARHLCRQLWADQRIPFLLLTSSAEHRSLDAVVFTPGDESVAPLRLNPFEVPVGTRVGRHIADLLRIFDAAYGLPEPLPLLYRRALTRIYRQCGHHPDVVGAEGLVWPTLREFVAAADFDVATRLRGEALLEGAAGATLDCRRSFDAGALVDRPVVVELGAAGDTAAERVLVGLLLLHVVRRAAQGRRHVIVIDDPALATDDAAIRIVHRGSLRARLMYPEPVPVLVPDPDVDGAAPTDVEVRGRFERLLDDPRFAAALAPFDECEECGHRCAYRRRAESVVLADPAAATRLVDQVADGSWAATAADLTALDGPEDYRMCVFVHAVRTARAAEPLQLVRQMRRHLRGNPVP